ncbi:hypothetical protein SAMN05216581_3376 [Pseudomonas asplenii]|uniref:Uncharacterized protein n=1 Tax=Pseudomonas asplenii TaxID=53407 RepID=A0A1H6NX15_9PSED|nr:hypothetical protein [Pseudomonas fuscovaginae]SEI17444.1 hypothetical protein SAMN05216581_3376 [Pseudomonas fuscovaginae]
MKAMLQRLSLLLALVLGTAWGANDQLVPINNGMNTLKIFGTNFKVFRAWRENYNAHGFDVVTFYSSNNDTWGLVPIFDESRTHEKLELTAGGGADCRLHDFRMLVSPDGSHAQLLVASRDPGNSYVDLKTVHFVYYELEKNEEALPGAPLFFFEAVKRVESRGAYCDVNDAMNDELHLGAQSGFCGKDCPER